MRFGFCHVPHEHYARHVELVRLAERLGFDRAWIPDQTFNHDPYVILAATALATDEIELGVGVANPFTRHPATTGRAIASVADIAPGRVSLGIGAGNVRELLHPLGFEFDGPADRCREAVELIRRELTGSQVGYEGRYYRMDGVRLEIEGEFDVPLYLAGRGPRVLENAGAVGDGVLIGGLCGTEGMRYALTCLRRGAEKAGRDSLPGEIGSWVTCQLTDDREAGIARIRPNIAHIIGGAPLQVMREIGLPDEVISAIKQAYARGGSSAAAEHVTDECVDAFAIVGPPEVAVERIKALEDAGATQFIFLIGSGDVDEQAGRLEQFASSVFPAFR
jgi:5,10-methylenetetrahydromethanopterin reductase